MRLSGEHLICVSLTIGFILLPAYWIWCSIRDKRQYRKDAHKNVNDAIDKITEDGKVEGPKGKFKRTGRRGTLTDGSTRPPKNPGYHGTPWP